MKFDMHIQMNPEEFKSYGLLLERIPTIQELSDFGALMDEADEANKRLEIQRSLNLLHQAMELIHDGRPRVLPRDLSMLHQN